MASTWFTHSLHRTVKRIIVIAGCVLTLAIIWFYLDDKEEENQKQDKPAGGESPAVSDRPVPSIEAPKRGLTKEDLKVIAITEEELKSMLEAPVEFYGQVLDQHDSPVKGTKISCSWALMGPHQTARNLLTDADGRFEVKNLKAVAIKILFYPPAGYRRLPAEEGKPTDFIQIADPPERITIHEYYKVLPHKTKAHMFIAEAYKPDKNKPMIFRVQSLER